MNRTLTVLTFEEWLAFVFDHPAGGPEREWYFDPDSDWWGGPADVTLRYLTRVFEQAGDLLARYTDAQVNQGLWYLASNACSNHMFALLDESVTWPERQRCLRSMVALNARCFAARCSATLGHRDEQPASPLNLVCYMWWDLLPIFGRPELPERRRFDQECLDVLAAILALPHLACQEGALHGLGHWALYYPQPVAATVDDYLARSANRSEPLRLYALAARRGMVL